MPPKKKSGKKKKGKKSGKASAGPTSNKQDHLSELSKEFYLIQIRDLENRLARYQKKCDELEVMNGKFREEHDQMSGDKKEIVSYLKKSLEQRGDEIADLNDRLIGLQQTRENEKEQYERELQQLQTTFQETKDQLTSENMILGGKLASLEEFKVQKEDLMAKFAAMEDSLKQQEENHKEIIYNLERKQVVDKDRLKKAMVMKVNQVASEFRKVSNKQMAETTKRTIRENVSINAQLAKMSDKTMEMISDNDDLKSKEKKQRQQLEMLEVNEKELAKKNHSNQKIIRMLTDKCKNQEVMIAEYEARDAEYSELEAENDLLRQQVEATREESQQLAKENEHCDNDIQRLEQDLAEVKKGKKKLEQVLADCATAIKVALTKSTTEDVEDSETAQMEKRDGMLENLLVLLNSAAALGLGPSPGGLGGAERERSASKMPGSGKGIRRGEGTPPQMPAGPHYQLGDLGIIPRPNNVIPSHLDRMKDLSQTTRLGTLKKVLTKSVATQTASAPKAMFYADQLMSRMPQTSQLIHSLNDPQGQQEYILPQLTTNKKVSGKVF